MFVALLSSLLLAATSAGGVPAAEMDRSLHRALTEALIERAELPEGAVVRVGELRVSDRALLERASKLSAVELPPGETGRSRVSARARLTLAGGGEAWTWVSAPVTVMAPTVVTTREVARGDTLGAADVSLELAELRRDRVTDVSWAVGRTARRGLRAGETLSTSSLQAAMLVRRGDPLTLVVRDGALVVRTAGEALERGGAGELIRVRIGASGRVLTARLIDRGSAEVQP